MVGQMLPRLAAHRALAGRGELYALLVGALAVLLDGRRRDALEAHALGLVDEVAPADALSHALGVARRIVDGTFTGTLWSPLAPGAATLAFPNVERDAEIRRLLPTMSACPEPRRHVPSSRRSASDSPRDWKLVWPSRRTSSRTSSPPTTDGPASIASLPEARCRCRRVASVSARPRRASEPSLDDVICPQEKRLRNGEAERLGGFEIDDELDLAGLLDWQVGGLRALEDLVHEGRGAPLQVQ